MESLKRASIRLWAATAFGIAGVAVQLFVRGDRDIRTQVIAQLVAFALFLPAAFLVWRGLGKGRAGLVVVLVVAALLRAAAFDPSGVTPPISRDIHRYAWDAHVQAQGINPYRYAPDSPALAGLSTDPVWPGIDRKSWLTVYPPASEASFLLSRAVFGKGLRASTWLMLLAEAGAIGLMLLTLRKLRAPLERVALYAWHPLTVSEIAGNGHNEALAVLGLSALMAAWAYRRYALAGCAIAFATLAKLGPMLLIPALIRRGRWRLATAIGIVTVAFVVPYLSALSNLWDALAYWAKRERFNGSLAELVRLGIDDRPLNVALAALLLTVLIVVTLRDHLDVEQLARSGLLLLGTAILISDYVQPWYAIWLIPFMVFTVAPGWLWLSGIIPLAYLDAITHPLPHWNPYTIYGPLFVWALVRALGMRRVRTPSIPALPLRPRVAAVIPALNEGVALRGLLSEWPSGVVDEILVVDGGSSDDTVKVAEEFGARVISETRPGYGRACAVGAAATDADILVFLDGDGSDDPASIASVLEPVRNGRTSLALGSRRTFEPGAIATHQRVGNRIVVTLVRRLYGLKIHDIPSLRVVRRDALESLGMGEMTYGWPTEMIVKAARAGLTIEEVPTSYRTRRGGVSKVAGRFGPSVRAGAFMLAVTLRHA